MRPPTKLEEVERTQLDVFTLNTAAQAEEHAATLVKFGFNVVSVFEETLKGATAPLFFVCVARRKTPIGPLGAERKK